MMGQTEIRPTATIYQFPFRERMAAKATREQRFARMEAEARRIGNGVMQGAWYHDDAVVESTGKMS